MKKIILNFILACGSMNSLQAYVVDSNQEMVLENLLSVKSINVATISNICFPDLYHEGDNVIEEGLSYKILSGSNTDLQTKALNRVETYAVIINQTNGYTFHVADYYGYAGNSRVVTCLDGNMRGLQGISDNGVIMAESTDVKWRKNYFEHKYPAGKVYSYPNKQIVEFK